MKLLGSTSSPYVRKVRVVLAEKKLDVEFVPEDVWSADTTIAESNPLGKVPCLIMEGAEALFAVAPFGHVGGGFRVAGAVNDDVFPAAQADTSGTRPFRRA